MGGAQHSGLYPGEGTRAEDFRNGGPDHEILEQIFEELRDWEIQLKHADIDWDELDDPGLDDPDLGL